jgi:hypothetical protein
MERYLPYTSEPISPVWNCETCHTPYYIALRRYQDTENKDDYGTLALVETSVRTACACTPEVTDVSKGRPELVPILEYPVSKPRTNIDDLLDYDKTS